MCVKNDFEVTLKPKRCCMRNARLEVFDCMRNLWFDVRDCMKKICGSMYDCMGIVRFEALSGGLGL